MPLQSAWDPASEVQTEVAASVLGLEAEHRVKLSLLDTELKEEVAHLQTESRNLHGRLRREICLRGNLREVSCDPSQQDSAELLRLRVDAACTSHGWTSPPRPGCPSPAGPLGCWLITFLRLRTGLHPSQGLSFDLVAPSTCCQG